MEVPPQNSKISKDYGDPLAPFLFLLVAECLGGLMRVTVRKGMYSGCRVGRGETIVSFLLVMDNVLFVGEPTCQTIFTLKAILRSFEMVSRLKVNFPKNKLGVLDRGILTLLPFLSAQLWLSLWST